MVYTDHNVARESASSLFNLIYMQININFE